jgi:hypothetical protein
LAQIIGCKKAEYPVISCSSQVVYEKFEEGYFFMPNAFTPSSDGLNDGLEVFKKGIKEYNLQVYIPNGGLVFETQNSEREFWYSSNNNTSGNYNYILQFTTLSGIKYTRTGQVAVIAILTLYKDGFFEDHCISNFDECVFGSQWQGDTLPLKSVHESREYFSATCN